MPMRKILILLLIASASQALSAQKLLQLEKAGTMKVIRFYIGDELTFQIRNDDVGWYTRTINDIDVDRNRLVFNNYSLPIDSISMIQLPKSKVWQVVGGALQIGGIAMAMSSAYWSITQNEPADWAALGTSAGIALLGTGMRKGMRKKKFKIGPYKRLRVLDLSFGPPVPANKT